MTWTKLVQQRDLGLFARFYTPAEDLVRTMQVPRRACVSHMPNASMRVMHLPQSVCVTSTCPAI